MLWIVPLVTLLSGCANVNQSLSTGAMADHNMSNMTRVAVGMNESQVLQIMHKPYSQKSLEIEQNQYNVWFYVTRVSGLNQSRMVPQNLTPFIFKNGVLQGWGFDYYNYLMQSQNEKPKATPKGTHEDVPLEKALDKAAAPPQKDNNSSGKILNLSARMAKQDHLLAMCSRPASAQPQNPQTDEDDEEKKPYLDEEGDEMMEEENDQNFNFW